jgi:hypothetical protein
VELPESMAEDGCKLTISLTEHKIYYISAEEEHKRAIDERPKTTEYCDSRQV